MVSTAQDEHPVVRVTQRIKPFNNLKRRVYFDQLFPSNSLFGVSEELFTIQYGGKIIKPKSFNASSFIQLTFDVKVETNDSIIIIEKDLPHEGDSTIVKIGIAEPIEEMDDEDNKNFYAIPKPDYYSKWILERPSLYSEMTKDEDEYLQNFSVKFISYEDTSRSVIFLYKGYRYRIPIEEECVGMVQLLQPEDKVNVQIHFYNCQRCTSNGVRLPSAIIQKIHNK